MQTIYHASNSRGHADYGWLNTSHTFSFSHYYNPERMGFGMLRVLNDDMVAPGMGFGTHPHENMEIISIPLDGALEHKDSMGHISVLHKGEVQVMSAGSGIQHSEYNHSKMQAAQFLQLWILPNELHVKPRYDQQTNPVNDDATFAEIVGPKNLAKGLWIHQQAWLSIGRCEEGKEMHYNMHHPGNGLYVFVIEGKVKISDQELNRRDGLAVWDMEEVTLDVLQSSTEILLIEIPLS